MAAPESTDRELVLALVGEACAYCEDGELVRGVHRGNPAIVCEDCETPTAQFW